MHTDAYDEVLSTPTEAAAKIAIQTPEHLARRSGTDRCDRSASAWIVLRRSADRSDGRRDHGGRSMKSKRAGGMFEAVRNGLVQDKLGESSMDFQRQVESGERTIVGVNRYQDDDDAIPVRPLERPDPAAMQAQLAKLAKFKADRSNADVDKALDALARACGTEGDNVFARLVSAAEAGATHGEMCACLRRELGFGQPLIAA